VLTGTIDPGKGFFMQQAHKTMGRGLEYGHRIEDIEEKIGKKSAAS